MHRLLLGLLPLAVALPLYAADAPPHRAIAEAAHRLFPDLPELRYATQIKGLCGADEGVNPQQAFCTTRNEILFRIVAEEAPEAAYELAHVFGHAVQVRHGVADMALREITQRRDEEDKLRGWVTRQVECIAGVIYGESGLPPVDLRDLYDAEPLTDSHWGRDPLSKGPKVSIGLEARAEWFSRGLGGDLSDCAVGEFGAELLLEARR